MKHIFFAAGNTTSCRCFDMKNSIYTNMINQQRSSAIDVKGRQAMNTLVVFYSRTGITRRAAEQLAGIMRADIEELVDLKNRSGFWGYRRACKDALRKRLTEYRPTLSDPGRYDLIVLATPVWAMTMAPAVRTYLEEHSPSISRAGFLCTMGGSGTKRTFRQMAAVLGKPPIATLAIKESQIRSNTHSGALESFAGKLMAQS